MQLKTARPLPPGIGADGKPGRVDRDKATRAMERMKQTKRAEMEEAANDKLGQARA